MQDFNKQARNARSCNLEDLVIGKPLPRQEAALRSLLKEAGIGKRGPILTREFTMAMRRGEILGCAGLKVVDTYAIVYSVAVTKAWRKRGIGELLVRESVTSARRQGVCYCVLTTMFWNVNFFRRCGFETTSRKQFPATLQGHKLFTGPKSKYTIPMVMALTPSMESSDTIDAEGRR